MGDFGQLLKGFELKITVDSSPIKNISEILFEFNPILEATKCLAKLIIVEPDVWYSQMPDRLRVARVTITLTHE